jgi:predicted SAM-dependent methyltransferase
MMSTLRVLEAATTETLDPQGYLAANADLKRAYGSDTSAAEAHFHQQGKFEGRWQIARGFFAEIDSFRRQKFPRFKQSLCEHPHVHGFPAMIGAAIVDPEAYGEGESANVVPDFVTQEMVANPDKIYADIGAGLRNVVHSNCAYLEVYPSLTADIVTEPTCTLPFASASLDGVGCFAVLEHVKTPWKLADEFSRVLKRGGKLFVSWPFLVPVHGYPSHYYNSTREGLREMFASRFSISRLFTLPSEGPDYTIHWILNGLLKSISDAEIADKVGAMTLRKFTALKPQSAPWIEMLSKMNDSDISMLSCGNTLIATKL